MRALFIALSLLCSIAGATAQNMATCGGVDRIGRLKSEDPARFAAIERDASNYENGEGLLWRIEKAGVPDSHLFGTMHVSDPRVLATLDRLDGVLRQTRRIAVELSEKSMAADAVKLFRRGIGSNLGTVSGIGDASTRDRLREALAEHSLPESVHDNLRPWLVVTLLQIPSCEFIRQGAEGTFLDRVLERRAVAGGAESIGLETMDEQIAAFESIAPDALSAMLKQFADMGSQGRADYFETTIQSYLEKNIGRFWMATGHAKVFADQEIAGRDEFMRALLDKRNLVMRDRSLPLLEKGNALIAVGAMHLPGSIGLVRLFREKGYSVTRVW